MTSQLNKHSVKNNFTQAFRISGDTRIGTKCAKPPETLESLYTGGNVNGIIHERLLTVLKGAYFSPSPTVALKIN